MKENSEIEFEEIFSYEIESDEYMDESNRGTYFILIIYDIADNKTRVRLSKLLSGYGFRIQKSSFEAVLPANKYEKLIEQLPEYVTDEDSIRIYRIIGKGNVICFGKQDYTEKEDVIYI